MTASPIGGAGGMAGAPAAQTRAQQVDTAAKQLEAFFLRQLLAEARPAGGGGIDAGFAGDTFKQMLDEALADKMAQAGGIGLAQMFAKQLGDTGEVALSPKHAPAIAAAGGAAPAHAPHAHPMPATTITPPVLAPSVDGAPALAMPVSGRATSRYGERVDPIHGTRSMHPGFDLAAPTGTRVGAAAAGEVVHAGPAGTYGNLVRVRHADGFETRYAHLHEVHVKVGDRVETGQEIGSVGSTGRSTGPHLHFEFRKDGKALDPSAHLPLHHPPNRATR